MDEYISKHEAYKMLKDKQAAYMQVAVNEAFGTAALMIDQMKPADVQPVKHGKWIIDNDYYTCSRCNHQYLKNNILSMTIYPSGGIPHYCSCCGADMRGDAE